MSFRILSLAVLLAVSLTGAAQDFNHNPQAKPDPARTEANAALEARDYAKAVTLLTALAAQNPKDALVLYDLGAAQDALDQTSAAEQSYRAAITDDATLLQPHLALGLLLARNGRRDEAHAELLIVTTLPIPASQQEHAAGADFQALAFRGLARLDQTARPPNLEAARNDLLSALKLSPETPDDIALAADLAIAAQDLPAAEQAYRRLLAKDADDAAATASLGHVLLLEKKPEEAETLLSAALAQHPGDPALVAQLASVYTAEGKVAQALPMVAQIHTAHPADGNVTRLLAHLYAESGDYAKAEPILSTLSAQTPQDLTLLDDRADALIHLRRYAEAETLLKPAVAHRDAFPTRDDFASAANHLAFAASENNDPAMTLQALTLRATVLPPSPSSLFLAAISYDKLHQVKQAKEMYRQFLTAAAGKYPDQEFQARHRLIALEPMK